MQLKQVIFVVFSTIVIPHVSMLNAQPDAAILQQQIKQAIRTQSPTTRTDESTGEDTSTLSVEALSALSLKELEVLINQALTSLQALEDATTKTVAPEPVEPPKTAASAEPAVHVEPALITITQTETERQKPKQTKKKATHQKN